MLFQQSMQKLCTSATIVPQPAQRGGSAKSSAWSAQLRITRAIIGCLSRASPHRTSMLMADLFDMHLRAERRDRAARLGPELFLAERAFGDCLDRLSLMNRRFSNALLLGCPNPEWPERLGQFADHVDRFDPGAIFAERAGGAVLVEDAWEPPQARYDLVLCVGTLDTVNDLPRALLILRWCMGAGGLLIGALSGGDTLPRLRSAMRAADAASGIAAPHVHPRVEASALAPLLTDAGLTNPVVDVDRVMVSYRSLQKLVHDLRRMGATNVLTQRSRRFLSKSAFAAASGDFAAAGDGERTSETFEIIHFAAWVATR